MAGLLKLLYDICSLSSPLFIKVIGLFAERNRALVPLRLVFFSFYFSAVSPLLLVPSLGRLPVTEMVFECGTSFHVGWV